MQFLLTFHGEMRWLVALTAVVVALRSLTGWLRGASFGRADRLLMTLMTILLDVNLLLGLTLLFALPGGLLGHRLEHAVTMVLAVAAAHSWLAWRGSEDSTRKFRNNFFVAVAVLALAVVGVLRLRGTWFV